MGALKAIESVALRGGGGRPLSDLLAESEFKREELNDELARRNAELEALRDRSAPLATISAIRDQFDSLSDQCEARGDIVAAMMCQIGRTLADQAIAETRAELI